MSTLQELSDHQEIGDLLVRYARAVDRCDLALFDSIWAPGAIVDYGAGEEDAAQWCRNLVTRLGAMDRTQHTLSNSLVALRCTEADAETSCVAYHRFTEDEKPMRMLVGGRYLDKLVRTGSGWRILRRCYVMDWNETEASTMDTGGRFARFTTLGARAPADPSYVTS